MKISLYDWCINNDKIDVINDWDNEKNINISQNDFTPKSSKVVFWKCHVCSNEWSSVIYNRTNGHGCPECAKKIRSEKYQKTIVGKNGSLAKSNYELVQEWNYDKNGDIGPHDVSSSSNKKYWWKCTTCGHEWEASPNSRSRGRGCPQCAIEKSKNGKIAYIVAKNGSFADLKPNIAIDWNFERNGSLTPSDVTVMSGQKVWWKCHVCGHEWETTVCNRSYDRECPNCSRLRSESKLQEKIRKYITFEYGFEVLHEKDCSILALNPKTKYPLPYDNDVYINGKHLIIETMGAQHFVITEYVKKDARKRDVTPEEELSYIQWKDSYKKQYALDNGYYYLAIPYTAEKDDQYKQLIDDKIHEIQTLNTTK